MGYPLSEPHDAGLLDVGDGQRLYWETCGNPAAAPVVVLHGGPGSGADADPAFRMRFARLVTHVWRHAAWLGDDELVTGATRLAGVPGVLIHGRADVSSPPEFAWRVHRAWPGSELVLVDGAGHGADDLLVAAVVAATDRFRAPP